MEYFVRTSHIIAGLTYSIVILGWLLPIFGVKTGKEWLPSMIIISCLSIVFFSFIHYIILGKFYPWAKMPDKENEKTD